jgi:hypothetical protein
MTVSTWTSKRTVWHFILSRLRGIVLAYRLISLSTLLVIFVAQELAISS